MCNTYQILQNGIKLGDSMVTLLDHRGVSFFAIIIDMLDSWNETHYKSVTILQFFSIFICQLRYILWPENHYKNKAIHTVKLCKLYIYYMYTEVYIKIFLQQISCRNPTDVGDGWMQLLNCCYLWLCETLHSSLCILSVSNINHACELQLHPPVHDLKILLCKRFKNFVVFFQLASRKTSKLVTLCNPCICSLYISQHEQ